MSLILLLRLHHFALLETSLLVFPGMIGAMLLQSLRRQGPELWVARHAGVLMGIGFILGHLILHFQVQEENIIPTMEFWPLLTLTLLLAYPRYLSRELGKMDALLSRACVIVYLLPFLAVQFGLLAPILDSLCTCLMLILFALRCVREGRARLFYLNLKLAALRFFILYLEALGGLMFNALILIATGALLIGAVILWRKYQESILTWAERRLADD